MFKYCVLLAIFLAVAHAQLDCNNYCNTFFSHCNSTITGISWYSSVAECNQVCQAFPQGNLTDTGGNTLGCRLYHAGAPAVANSTLHCPHASPSGGLVCGDYCDAYCSIGLFHCSAASGWPLMESGLFNDQTDCHSVCSTAYAVGDINDISSANTLGCRLYHAQASIFTGDLTHCSHASASGNGVCTDNSLSFCDNYCQINHQTCTGTNAQYASEAACLSYCQNDMTNFQGNWNDTSGDTIGCRIYHSTAGVLAASTHCPHSGPSGANACGTWCEVYCDLITQNCVGSNQQYTSKSTCMTACGAIPSTGNPGDTTGDTVQCRIYHAGVAGNPSTNAPVHCPHAGPTGAGQCVNAATGSTAATTASTTGKSSASSVVASLLLVVAMIALLL